MERSDYMAIAAAAGVILLAGFALYREAGVRLGIEGEAVGHIEFRRGVAERKYAGRAVWESLRDNDPVYNRNTIRTDEDSEAYIELDDQTGVELGEQSMILIEVREDAVDLDLRRGVMRLNRSGASFEKDLVLRFGDRVLKFDAGQMRMQGEADGDLEALSGLGDISVRNGAGEGRDMTIRAGQRAVWKADADRARLEDVEYTLLSPERGRTFFAESPEGRTRIAFSWRATGDQARNRAARLELSRDPYFSEIAVEQLTDDSSAELRLPPGLYYWRVSSPFTLEGASDAGKLRVLRKTALRIISPAPRARFAYSAEPPTIAFAWSGGVQAEAFFLEVFADAALRQRIAGRQVQGRSLSLQLPQGEYFFRVRALSPEAGGEDQSEIRAFRVENEDQLLPPEPRLPAAGAALSVERAASAGAGFLWSDSLEPLEYVLQIARDREFNQMVQEVRAASNAFRWKPEAPAEGEYFWRVAARNAAGKQSEFSKTVRFRISKTPEADADSDEDASADTSADSSASAKPAATTATADPADSAAASANDSAAGSASAKTAPSHPAFTGPLLLAPGRGAAIDMAGRSNIVFRWKEVPGASAYVLRLYNGGPGRARVHEERIAGTRKVFTELRKLDIGRFGWSVTALDANGAELYSESAAFTITLSQKLDAPELIVE